MLTIKSQRIIDFYDKHSNLDFEAVNLIFVDLLEKLVDNMSNNLNQSLSLDILKDISSKINSLETKTQEIDITTKNYLDSIKVNIEHSVSTQKDHIISSFRDLLQNDAQSNYINIDKLFSKNYEQLSSRILDNINQLPKEVISSTNSSFSSLSTEIQNTHSSISNEIQQSLLSQHSNQDISKHITTLIDTNYNQLNSSISARIETVLSQFNSSNSDILNYVKPMKTVEEYFYNMNNSNRKGKQGEAKLQPILETILPDSEVLNSSGTSNSGDFIIKRKELPTILIDTKDWSNQVSKEEVGKIIRDIDTHKCNGILMSQNSGIALKSDWEINIHNNYILLFLHNVKYDEDKILTAIKIIDVLFPIIKQQNEIEHQSISSELLSDINREFQELISQKTRIIQQIEQHNKQIIKEVSKLDMCSLSSLLKSKFSQHNEMKFKCDFEGCNYTHSTSRGLAAHKKKHMVKCKKIESN